jgi:hypothetical protein
MFSEAKAGAMLKNPSIIATPNLERTDTERRT